MSASHDFNVQIAKQLYELCRKLREGKEEEVKKFIEESPKTPSAMAVQYVRNESMSSAETLEEEEVRKKWDSVVVFHLVSVPPDGGGGG